MKTAVFTDSLKKICVGSSKIAIGYPLENAGRMRSPALVNTLPAPAKVTIVQSGHDVRFDKLPARAGMCCPKRAHLPAIDSARSLVMPLRRPLAKELAYA